MGKDSGQSANSHSSDATSSSSLGAFLTRVTLLLWMIFILVDSDVRNLLFGNGDRNWLFPDKGTAPLVMKGGDPYIRALMRTISASEANVSSPYTVLYGGDHVNSLNAHPDRCMPIHVGPNTGNCSTAAGRYQMITTTWLEQARQYHPQGFHLLFWENYSFEPQYQDQVVYKWLSDPQAWGVNLRQLLKEGRTNEVLQRLSGTWTSLGYGIETNSMSGQLPQIYRQMLKEELSLTSTQPAASGFNDNNL
jgi:muramidase (phage lysozyme)